MFANKINDAFDTLCNFILFPGCTFRIHLIKCFHRLNSIVLWPNFSFTTAWKSGNIIPVLSSCRDISLSRMDFIHKICARAELCWHSTISEMAWKRENKAVYNWFRAIQLHECFMLIFISCILHRLCEISQTNGRVIKSNTDFNNF